MLRISVIFLTLLYSLHLQSQVRQESWMAQVIPLSSCDPENLDTDLENIGASLGSAKVVGLGETTHGTREIFTMKHRMIRYLIKEKGFNVIAFESNKPETAKINAYILGEEGDPKQLLKGIYFWTWQTQEILDLINWLRSYNATKDQKVQFLGIDMQYYQKALKNIEDRFAGNEIISKEVQSRRLLYQKKKLSKADHLALQQQLDILQEKINQAFRVESHTKEFQNVVNADLKILEQAAKMNQSQSSSYRDACMANYVKDYQSLQPENKVIVWAHNMHISKDAFWKMGNQLKKIFGKDYFAIGFSLAEGYFTAKDYQNNIKRNHQLKAIPKRAVETKLLAVGKPLFYIDCKHLAQDKWFYKKRKFRDIGAALWGSEFLKINLLRSYDGIVFIKNSTSSVLFN